MKKTPWQQPQLLVMARSRPEEAVLTACKESAQSGPKTVQSGCMSAVKYEEKKSVCFDCDNLVVS